MKKPKTEIQKYKCYETELKSLEKNKYWKLSELLFELYNGKKEYITTGELVHALADDEWDLGRHGARQDETKGHCTNCGIHTIYLKLKDGKLLCRYCRGVCTDCGREDITPNDLKQYANFKEENLCPDCRVCRLY